MQSKQKRHKPMSVFLSTIVLVVGGLLFAVALVYWDKGGYANNWKAMWWGIGAFEVLGIGMAFTFYSTVIVPSRQTVKEAENRFIGVSLTEECDKWIESGKALRERLINAETQKHAVEEAPNWLDD